MSGEIGAYAKSLIAKLKVTDEELRDDVIQRWISQMNWHERQQSMSIISARQMFETRLSQLRRGRR